MGCDAAGRFWAAICPSHARELAEMAVSIGSQRIDARLARDQGIRFSDDLLASLRKSASEANGHEVAILAGGFQTDAHWCSIQDDLKGIRDFCHDCSQNVTPSTRHVLWECPTWNQFRQNGEPTCPFLATMAWSNVGVDHSLVQQMASIRRVHAVARAKRGSGDAGGGLPALRSCGAVAPMASCQSVLRCG